MSGSDKCVQAAKRVMIILLMLMSPVVWGQPSTPKSKTTEVTQEPSLDTLGRSTPRGAVLNFLNVARKGNAQIAALYLNTPLRGEEAEVLAHQLGVVLNRRLPARLNELSDKPEGSLPDPLRPDEDLIGTISTANGSLDIRVERIDRGKAGKVWLFSRKTLDSIPAVYQELSTPVVEALLPEFLVKTRLVSIPLFEWLAVFVGMPFLYFLTGSLNRLLGLMVGGFRRHLFHNPTLRNPNVLLPPIRLLLLALVIFWSLSRVGLPLLAPQFWSTTVLIITITATMWLLVLLNGRGERYLVGRRPTVIST